MQTALWIHAKRAAFTLGPNTIPSPGLGEILVRLHSIALNPVDWKFQDLGWDLEYPSVFGHEGAGTVEDLGAGVKQFVKGDKVLHQGTASVFKGTFQQYALVPEIIASKIPDQLSFDEATTLPLGIATAAVPLYSPAPKGLAYEAPWEDHGRGKYAGHPILILGGSSTVGQYVIQFAKASGFAPIIATSSPSNFDLLTSLGATHTIDRHLPFSSSSSSIVSEISRITSKPITLVYDAISLPDTQQGGYDLLAPGGRIIVTMGSKIKKSEGDGKRIVPVDSNFHVEANRSFGAVLMRNLGKLIERGDIKPVSVEVVNGGLGGIVDGLGRLKNNQVSARKLVVRPWETE